MKRILIPSLAGLLAVASTTFAQTTTSGGSASTASSSGLAPFNFGNLILTSTPSNATGAGGISTVYTTSGRELTFGTGGKLVSPTPFNYVVTGPNTATISYPAADGTAASSTDLAFTSANSGSYTTVKGGERTTGTFGLSAIPGAAPIENVSARTTVTEGGHTIIGFVVGGTMPRRVLVRAVGPGLTAFGVTAGLQNPTLSLYRGSELIATNDDWGTAATANTSVGGTGPTNSGGASSNVSTTGTTSTSTDTTSVGVNAGVGATTGAAGSLGAAGGNGGLLGGAAPVTQLATADDFVAAGAFSLADGSRDAAFVATLAPGAYTVIVTNGTASVIGTSMSGSTAMGPVAVSGSSAVGATTTINPGATASSNDSPSGSMANGAARGTTGTASTTATNRTSAPGTGAAGTSVSAGANATFTGGPAGTLGNGGSSGDVLVEVYFIE